MFSAEAEIPLRWECRTCGQLAVRLGAEDEAEEHPAVEHVQGGRTPWEMLLERRSLPELEVLLQDRLDWLRTRRSGSSEE